MYVFFLLPLKYLNADHIGLRRIMNNEQKAVGFGGGRSMNPPSCVLPVQTGSHPFNRAMLFNVGFLEAMKDLAWDCLVFHDVDHIPENDRNYYGCGQMPRHFAAKLDKYMYM